MLTILPPATHELHLNAKYLRGLPESIEQLEFIDLAALPMNFSFTFDFGDYRSKMETLKKFGSCYRRIQNHPTGYHAFNLLVSMENPFVHVYLSHAQSYFPDYVDLALGQLKPSQVASAYNNYLEFPLILQRFFDSFTGRKGFQTLDDLQSSIDYLEQQRTPELLQRPKINALIASHDIFNNFKGVRLQLHSILNQMFGQEVFCPGKLLHNDDDLKEKFANEKIPYLRQFIFNVCPENSYAPGYVTEKFLDALLAGCIPIYWGGIKPLLNVFNEKAFFYFNPREPKAFVHELAQTCNNTEKFDALLAEKIFLPGAAARLFVDYFYPLYRKMFRDSGIPFNAFRLHAPKLPADYSIEDDLQRAREILLALGQDPRGKQDEVIEIEHAWPFLIVDAKRYYNYSLMHKQLAVFYNNRYNLVPPVNHAEDSLAKTLAEKSLEGR